MRLNIYSSFLVGFFVLMLIYWQGLQMSHTTDLPINLGYSFSTAVLAFFGGVFGILISRRWGGVKSAVGKAVLLMSLGTLVWSLGNFVWSYYIFFLHTEIPYPSLADIGYSLAVPMWVAGVYFLSQATGARFTLRKARGRMMLVVLPVLAALVSYYFLFVVARGSSMEVEGGLLKIFLDFYYPIGDWIILTVSFLLFGLSWEYLGGRFRLPVFILLIGFVFMFMADFSFSYTTTVGSYFNGSYPDLLFATALFVMGFGINSLDTKEGG